MSYDYNSWEPVKVNVDELTERETNLLRDSKTFCIYPWVHLHTHPTGEAYPCCGAEMQYPVGSSKQNSINELINSDNMKSLRLDMLNGVKRPECQRCYEQEEAGFFNQRKSANKHFGHHIKEVEKTQEDGTYNDFKMRYLDIRFSNLCNLKCRSCGHIFSSQWHKDQIKVTQKGYWNNIKDPSWPAEPPTSMAEFAQLPEKLQHELETDFHGEIFRHIKYGEELPVLNIAGKFDTDMLEQVLEHVDSIEQIYFAGGEPLVMEEHYAILDKLIELGKTDVRLIYNTNFTQVKLKKKHAFDQWKHFPNVAVGASLDAMGKHAEYIRSGTKWEAVEKYREQLMEQCPHVDFYISCTLSIMNALHVTDFHRTWVEKGYIKPQDFNVNILQDPKYYRIDIATPEYKAEIRKKFEEHLAWLEPLDHLKRATTGFNAALTYMETDNTALIEKFWKQTDLLDEIRNENILDFIPELKALR